MLLLGSGGHEHAYAWKMLQSSWYTKLFVATENSETAQIATNVSLKILDFDDI